MERFEISLNGETILSTRETWSADADALVARHGGGVPSVRALVQVIAPALAPSAPKIDSLTPTGVPTSHADAKMSISGQMRSEADLIAAKAAGFAPAQPHFARGTQVIQLGVDNFIRSRQEHEVKPLVRAACEEFRTRVAGEDRRDAVVALNKLKMRNSGEVEDTSTRRVAPMTTRAFRGLCSRLGIQGVQYLTDSCWPELRALNVNEHITLAGDKQAVLRVRNAESARMGREIFAVVSEKYTPFDVDSIAEAIQLAAPGDARMSIDYDGDKAKFEIIFHTDIAPEQAVAGEFFKAGVVIETGDTGGHGIRGSSVIWQNLCLNLICIDRASQPAFNLRHVGSVRELAHEFRKGFAKALSKIDYFQKAWGYAHEDNVTQSAKAQGAEGESERILRELFLCSLERDLVPVVGRKEKAADDLMKMWSRDTSAAGGQFTRASVVNAFTRYAHEVNQDPWMEHEIQKAAGALLYGVGNKAPAPLPWAPADR